MKILLAIVCLKICVAQTWLMEDSGTKASLRGVSSVNAKVAWASGTEGTWLRTLDGGVTWHAGKVSGAEGLDFRGLRAFDERRAYLMSSGPGDKSRIYRTEDGGEHWSLQFTNPDAKGFFDAIAFWDATHGIVAGDAVGGRMTIFTTDDAGAHWGRLEGPAALAEEGAFAASNSCLVVRGAKEAWFATGGPGAARVFHSADRGRHWTASTTPLRNDAAATGIFSLAFRDSRHGIAVGGDYKNDREIRGNVAISSDGGCTWVAPSGNPPSGYRSSIVYLADRKAWIATGTSGSDISYDDGKTWKRFDDGSLNALSGYWGVGKDGRVARLQLNLR